MESSPDVAARAPAQTTSRQWLVNLVFGNRPEWLSHLYSSVLRVAAGTGAVLVLIWTAYQLHLNFAASGFLQLLIVLVVARRAGFWEATVTSVIANICLNYFFVPPVFSFVINDPQNWVALAVFEFSALLVSRLSAETRRQAVRASNHETELERLYAISRQLLLLDPHKAPGADIVRLIQTVFSVESIVLLDASVPKTDALGSVDAALTAETRAAYLQDRDVHRPDAHVWISVLRLGVRPIGALALCGPKVNLLTASALASLAAIVLERAHSFERESRAIAERQLEELRTAVLDALAHDFKTPLTAIRTASTGLIEMGNLTPVQLELAALVDNQTAHLDELTTRLLQMSRLDKHDIQLHCEATSVDDIVHSAVRKLKQRLSARHVRLEGLEETDGLVRVDRDLVVIALTQYLDNAAKYSNPDSPITITALTLPTEVQIGVHSEGPPIPREERERIFERLFRGEGGRRRAAGTGIGLSICKKVAEAHRGRVWVKSDAGCGTTFFLALPRLKEKV
ncbi:MAG: DUF4118 domain-containing protein [Acidobacteriaceae bacterium]|nr:DUF4118 domain-containing protein [Acidobacteriaceae bacterium]